MLKYNYYIKSYLTLIVLLSVVLSLSSCGDIPEQRLFGRRSLKKALLWAQEDSIRVADSLKRTVIVVDNIDDTPQVSLSFYEEEVLTSEDPKNQYYVIVGTYSIPENAKAMAEQFRNKGYPTKIIRSSDNIGNNLDMVSVHTCTNVDEAMNYLKQFHDEVDSSAWLYQNK